MTIRKAQLDLSAASRHKRGCSAREVSKMFSLAADIDVCRPAPGPLEEMNTRHAAGIIRPLRGVQVVLGWRDLSQIYQPVVGPVAVSVVDLDRPAPEMQRERDPVRQHVFAESPSAAIPPAMPGSKSRLAGAFSGDASRLGIVGKRGLQFSNHDTSYDKAEAV